MAGLAVGIAFVLLFSFLIPIGDVFMQSRTPDPEYYYPLLQLSIAGVSDAYFAGEGIDFAVAQKAGGCAMPDLIMIRDLERGNTVWMYNRTESGSLLSCPVITDPADFGQAWNSIDHTELPLVINQTGTYEVVARHLFKTVHKEFKVMASNGSTSPERLDRLLAASKDTGVVNALLEKYPDADLTIATANYYSEAFQRFQQYSPNGIVQYSAKTNSDSPTVGEEKELAVTIIFGRDGAPSTAIVVCSSESHRSLLANAAPSRMIEEINRC